jgi:NDP-sugar pyrophosphorylase family protein
VSRNSVSEGAKIVGPSVIEDEAVVAGAMIGPNTYVSSRCVVGPLTSINGSVLYEDVRVGARCRISDSIIDQGVSIPDGAEVASQIISRAKP